MTTMIYITQPGVKNYTVVQGQTFYDAFTFLDTLGSPANLTGWKARFTAREKGSTIGSSSSLALTEASGITLGGAAGTVVITATPTITRTMRAVAHEYQFEFEDAAGAIQTYLIGTITVSEEIAHG